MSPSDADSDDGPQVVSRQIFVERMAGCITDETRRPDSQLFDPLELKADWTSDLP